MTIFATLPVAADMVGRTPPVLEITTDQGLCSWNGTNWVALGSGGGTGVSTTGTPASGNLTKFSGAGTITSGNLSGDVTTTNTLATTIAAGAVTLTKLSLALQALLGVASVTDATPGAGPLDDYSPTGYVAAATNRLIVTATSGGGTIIDGIVATAVPDGFILTIQNASTTDVLTFAHLAAGSAAGNRFSNPDAGPYQIGPLAAKRASYIVNKWVFV